MLSIGEILKATSGKLAQKGRTLSSGPSLLIKNFSIDSRNIKKGDCFIALKGKNFDGHDFIKEVAKKGAVCIVIDSSFKLKDLPLGLTVIKVKDTQLALGAMASFMRRKYNIPVIAITGSAGKTTAKEMLAWVLAKKYNVLYNEGTKNNQIGLPLTLLKLKPEHDLAVLELGTNHFGEIDYLTKICQPNIGVITNIGPAHLEYFKSLEGVLKEKGQLVKGLKKPCIGILNSDDKLLNAKFLKTKKDNFFSFGIKNSSDYQASLIQFSNSGISFLVNGRAKIKLNSCGKNNIYNALIAVSVARIFGVDYKDIISRISKFKFPKGRLNLIELNRVKFIDDTYNANPLSLKAALDAIEAIKSKGRKIFVMGDMLELGESENDFHFSIGQEVARICDVFVGVGSLSKFAAEAAKNNGLDAGNIFTCSNSQEAREVLFNKISPNKDDLVLVKGSRGMKMEEIFK